MSEVKEAVEGREYTVGELSDHLGELLAKIFKSPTEPDVNDIYSAQLISQSIIAMIPTEVKELKESVCQLHESVSILASATKEILNRIDTIEKSRKVD